jgi:hypothetical protein
MEDENLWRFRNDGNTYCVKGDKTVTISEQFRDSDSVKFILSTRQGLIDSGSLSIGDKE